MKLLADLNIAPRTVSFLRGKGYDVTRVSDANGADSRIVELARQQGRAVLTQDLDFSAIVALSGETDPSVISLRLGSSRVDDVNTRLAVVLPVIAHDVSAGAIVTVEDGRVRSRLLPIG